MAISERGYIPKYFGLTVGSTDAGWLSQCSGGNATGTVVTETIGTDVYQHKHLSNVGWAPLSVQCGAGMTGTFQKWIAASFSAAHRREPQGAINACDTDLNILSTLNFFDSLITSVAMPALDASSKDNVAITIGIQPEYTKWAKGSGKLSGQKIDPKAQKSWTAANFSLKVDGHPDACKHASKVDGLTLSQATVNNPTGESRLQQIEPGALTVPNLVATIAESHMDTFYAWHQDFVIGGNCTQDKELTGSLEFLAADAKTVLYTVNFTGLGIFDLLPDALSASASAIRNCKVSMYCEKMDISSPGGGMWA